jgi:hypothetical protein
MRKHKITGAIITQSPAVCPVCGAPMRIATILPTPARSADEITYRCDGCRVEDKRIMRPLDR